MHVNLAGRYTRIQFRAAPAGDKLQRKIDEILKQLPNVFDIADDSFIVISDGDDKNTLNM